MYEYQAIRDAHLIKLGIDEEGEPTSDKMTLDELDELKKSMGVH